MADYWKSQPRKFCQYCKCWIADNKPSVEFHERGKNHKENVAAKIAEIKKKSVAKAKQEQKMSKDFAAMEEAALKAYEEDLKRLATHPSGEAIAPSPDPVPAQTQPKKPKRKRPEGAPSAGGGSERTAVWVRGNTDDGMLYYYNTLTGESQWEKPDELVDESVFSSIGRPQELQERSRGAWMEALSPDGYTYYYNTETGESSWERPEGFSPDEISPPGVEPPQELTGTPDDSSPPRAESETTSDSPKETEADEPQQSGVPKISFRKRKEEPTPEPAGDGGEKSSDDGGNGEEKQEDTSRTVAVTEVVIPVKRARKSNPYGAWEKIQPEQDPYEEVDLQLPQVETDDAPIPADIPPEPRSHFKERTITSLGDEAGAGAGSTFRRRKTENGKARSLRQREKDD